jgi:5-methylcytosine-specific restriction protein A
VRRDQRSDEAKAWRKLYSLPEWKQGRKDHLRQFPTCEPCSNRGKLVLATIVNHRTPHKGDLALFLDRANWQSTCASCHDGEIQQAELNGYSLSVDATGNPTDPRHPWNVH